jgi:hypothetical protein
MSDVGVDAVLERWRACCQAAGVRLTEADIAQARSAQALELVAQREGLIRRINAWPELPDYLDLGALERGEHA